MKYVMAALTLTAALSSTAFAEDHLYPEPSIFGGDAFSIEYDRQVVSVLKDAMDDDVVLRMIFLPSFIPESAVGIRKRGGKFEIFSVHPSEQIWDYRERHAGKVKIGPHGKIDGTEVLDFHRDDPDRMPVKLCSIGVPQSVENVIATSWEGALRAVHFDGKRDLGADGAFYHFAMRKEPSGRRYVPEFLAGQIWLGGPPGPRMGALTNLAMGMDKYCETRDVKMLNALASSARALAESFH